jgi:hypothetical protein
MSFNQALIYDDKQSNAHSLFLRGIFKILNSDIKAADEDIKQALELDKVSVVQAAQILAEKVNCENMPIYNDAGKITLYLQEKSLLTSYKPIDKTTGIEANNRNGLSKHPVTMMTLFRNLLVTNNAEEEKQQFKKENSIKKKQTTYGSTSVSR